MKLCGVILNSRNVQYEYELVQEFCDAINTKLIHCIPRDNAIAQYEKQGKTIIEGDVDANMSKEYFLLAEKIRKNKNGDIPSPLKFVELKSLCDKYLE